MADNEDSGRSTNALVTRGSEALEVAGTTQSVKRELRTLRRRRGPQVKKPARLERTRKLHSVVVNLVPALRRFRFGVVPAGSCNPPGPGNRRSQDAGQNRTCAGAARKLYSTTLGRGQLLSASAFRSHGGPDLPKTHTRLHRRGGDA